MQFRANEKLRTERMTECRACEHYNKEHGTCGTPRWLKPQGDTVTHYRSKRKLCGCKMSLKVQLIWSSCPLGKWKGTVSPDQMKKLSKFIKSLFKNGNLTQKLNEDQKKELNMHIQIVTGQPSTLTKSVCGPCYMDAINELMKVVRDFEGM